MELNVGNVTSTYTDYQKSTTAKKDTSKKAEEINTKEEAGAVYEQGSQTDKKATYSINKMTAEDRAELVKQLKQDELDRRNQLASLVQKMFAEQSGVVKLSELFSPENLKDVTAADIAKAKEDVSEDGYYGVKQTSQRMFDFACALAGDDVEKMKKMQEAVKEGYEKAEKAWGDKLPDICKETLAATDKLFEDYYASMSAE